MRAEEWARLNAFLAPESIPDPRFSQVAIAETNGKIVGFLVAQTVIHTEPLYIDEKFTHAVRFTKLAQTLKDVLGERKYYSFSKSTIIEKMLKFMGFKELGYKVWKRD